MSGSYAARVVRGIAALVVLAGVLVGIPIALLNAGGDPLDKHLPTWHGVWHAVTTTDQTGHTFITVAIVVAWLAWLAFAVAVLLDTVGRLRNRPPLRIPGLRVPQRAAAGLLTAVAMMMGTAGPAAAAYAAPPPAVVQTLPPAAAPTSTVAPSEPAPGAPAYYTVARGDNLTHIAERFYGDFDAYQKIAAANPQLITSAQGPHGPDHIDIGWKLRLPDGARDRGPIRHANGTATAAAMPVTPGTPPSEPSTGPAPGPVQPPGPANPGPVVAPTVPPPLVTFGPAVPIPTPAGSGPAHQSNGAADSLVLAATALTAGALGAHLVLWRRRRRAAGAGATGAFAAERETAVEPELEAGPAVEFNRLDLALRDLASLLGDRDAVDMPDIMGAWLVDGAVHLMLTQPCPAPPAPWVAKGLMWTLPAHSPTRRYFAGTTAPLPALVTVGGADDRRVFLDLERLGVVTIGGDPSGATALLRHVGAELVQGIWSEGVQVGIAGFNRADTQQLVALGGGRVHASGTVSEALDTAAQWVGEVHDRLTGIGAPSVLSGRVSATPADAQRLSPYALLLAGPDAADLERLERLDHYLAGLGRGQIAIATTTQANMGRWPMRVDTDHHLTMEFLDTRVPAVALDDAELATLARMPESGQAPTPPPPDMPIGRHRPANRRQTVG